MDRMGRPRTRDRDLPPRMYAKKAADGTRRYYYGRQMLALGSDLAAAKRLWAEYEYASPNYTVEHLVSRYLDILLPSLAANSVRMYRHGAKVAIAQWGSMSITDLRAPHLARYRDLPTTTKTRYNMARVVLLGAYKKAIEWGWAEHNPAESLAPIPSEIREVYLEDHEYDAIYAAAPGWMRLAMDVAYATALRPIDVINIRWSDVGESHLTVLPQKTARKVRVAQQYQLTESFRALLARAKARPVVGLYVVADDRGRRILQRRYQVWWRTLRAKLGLEHLEFRDIRSKSGTDREHERGELADAQRLLGHQTARMTERYMKKLRVRVVEPQRRKA